VAETTRQTIIPILRAAHPDDSTPDEAVVSSKFMFDRTGFTISSAEADEKHMTISTISVILSKFR